MLIYNFGNFRKHETVKRKKGEGNNNNYSLIMLEREGIIILYFTVLEK